MEPRSCFKAHSSQKGTGTTIGVNLFSGFFSFYLHGHFMGRGHPYAHYTDEVTQG